MPGMETEGPPATGDLSENFPEKMLIEDIGSDSDNLEVSEAPESMKIQDDTQATLDQTADHIRDTTDEVSTASLR